MPNFKAWTFSDDPPLRPLVRPNEMIEIEQDLKAPIKGTDRGLAPNAELEGSRNGRCFKAAIRALSMRSGHWNCLETHPNQSLEVDLSQIQARLAYRMPTY